MNNKQTTEKEKVMVTTNILYCLKLIKYSANGPHYFKEVTNYMILKQIYHMQIL